ncbi:hypothetical protein B0F90DRAFT_1623730 [Multifurca ochricompacta]|uniref:Uncharacterized protein n=1 Tax=Multifurca ochricompacta TaxID=376703 RepID=A0AAD4M9U1_9AGAM|nr:hypothetical protein B0F90DRAFT_1623730 [Multifurca ochricompacta]
MDSPTKSSSAPHPNEPVHAFVPRPFPHPSLVGVPLEYIIDSLRKLAPRYWNNIENADCSISTYFKVPVPTITLTVYSVYPLDIHPSGLPPFRDLDVSKIPRSEVLSGLHDPSGMGRRLTAPTLNNEAVRVLMKLHVDYLSAQSTLLRALFSGASPLDLIQPIAQSAPQVAGRPSISAGVASRLPRLLPSPPDHPIVFLPIPDSSSFPYLVTWMYFGDTSALEDALQRHVIRWDGLARNVEYLGMPEDIKRFLGRWYRRWLQYAQQPGNTKEGDESDDAPRGRLRSREQSHPRTRSRSCV